MSVFLIVTGSCKSDYFYMSGTVSLTHAVPKTLEKIFQAGTGAGAWWILQDSSLNVIMRPWASGSQCPARGLVPAGQE